MKIESKELEDRRVELTVEVPDDQTQRAMHSAARRLSKETKIPGFRPGKAPYEVMVSKFGEETIFDEALDELGQEIYRAAIDEAELEPYAPGIFNGGPFLLMNPFSYPLDQFLLGVLWLNSSPPCQCK